MQVEVDAGATETDEQVEVDAGAAETDEQGEEANATPAPATPAPVPNDSDALPHFSPVSPPWCPPPPMTPNHVLMLKAAMNRPHGLVPRPSTKPGTSTLAASSSNTPMSTLPQPADASLGEAALDEVVGRGNATGDGTGQMAIGTGAGVSDVEEANDQEAGVGNMDFGIGLQGDGRATMGSGSGLPTLGCVMGQQGFGRVTMGVQSPWPRMAGCPLAPQPMGVFAHPFNFAVGLGGASASRSLTFPGFSPHPFNYEAGLGGAAASSSMSFAPAPPKGATAAPPQGATAAPPQGAAAALHSDAWLRKAYVVPPSAYIDTIQYIEAQEQVTPSVPIAEIFAFAMLLRATYRDKFIPGVKLLPTDEFKALLNNSHLFALLLDPKPPGPFTGDQVCFLIAVRFICQSTSAATQLMGFLTNRDKGKIGMRVAKLFDPRR